MDWIRNIIGGGGGNPPGGDSQPPAQPPQTPPGESPPRKISSEELEVIRRKRLERLSPLSAPPVVVSQPTPATPIPTPTTHAPQPKSQKPPQSLAQLRETDLDGVLRLLDAAPDFCARARASLGSVELTERVIDSVLVERLMSGPSPHLSHADLLASCVAKISVFGTPGNLGPSAVVGASLLHLCLSYLGAVLQFPDLFCDGASSQAACGPVWNHTWVYQLLWDAAGRQDGVAETLLEALCSCREESVVTEMAMQVARGFIERCRGVSTEADFTPTLRPLSVALQFPPIVEALTSGPFWIPAGECNDGALIERETVLGAAFSLSPLSARPALRASVCQQFFPLTADGSLHIPEGRVAESLWTLHRSIQAVQTELMMSLRSIIKCSTRTREALLSWLSAVLRVNAPRAKISHDPSVVSSDGMMLNLAAVLLEIVSPLADRSLHDAAIDPVYLLKSSRLALGHETKLATTSSEAASWWVDPRNASRQANWNRQQKTGDNVVVVSSSPSAGAAGDSAPPNFATECFFVSMRAYNLAVSVALGRYYRLVGSINEGISAERSIEERRDLWSTTPEAPQHELSLQRIRMQTFAQIQHKLLYDVHILSETLLDRAGRFFGLFASWALFTVSPAGPQVPLPSEVPMEFACLPEFVVGDLAEFVRFAAMTPGSTGSFPFPSLCAIVDFLVCFVCSPAHVRSPFLRAKLIEALEALIPDRDAPRAVTAAKVEVFYSHELSKKFLIPALFQFYVDVELTGSHTQFYDKISWRLTVQKLLRYLWSMTHYRQAVVSFATSTSEKYVEVFNRVALYIVNDTNFQLDECLAKLAEIGSIQREMSDSVRWGRLDGPARAEKENMLQSAERSVRSFMRSAESNLDTLHVLCRATPASFVRDNAVTVGVASLLNYFSAQLVSSESSALKVENPARYHFKPELLLRRLGDVYVALGPSEDFVRAVACDTRSFKSSLLPAVAEELQELRVGDPDTVGAIRSLASRVSEVYMNEQGIEELLGEIPSEFTDPLMLVLMRDPVVLPASKTVVDRSTISRHLLSDPTDPFTRTPLSISDVVPDVALKTKIQAFIAQKLSASRGSPKS